MDIKEYWEHNPPQVWYSDKKPKSNEWFNEIEYKRYKIYYPYLKDVAEFDNHYRENVLEIGYGIGTDLLQYAKGGAKIYGIEVSKHAYDLTKSNLSRLKYKMVHPYRKKFDLIYIFGVLHHLEDPKQMLDDIYRMLKDDGKVIAMVYAPGWKHFVKRILINGILKLQIIKYGYQGTINRNTEVNGNCPLTRVYKKNQIKDLFSQFFYDVEITRHRLGEYFDYAPYNSWKFPSFLTRFLYFIGAENILGENWIIKAYNKPKKRLRFIDTLSKP